MPAPLSLFDRVWARHVIVPNPQGEELLFVDKNLVHEGGTFLAFDQMRAEGAALVALLRADTLDLSKLRELMQAQQGRMVDRIEMGRDLVAERIAAMSAEDRRAFADRLERAFQHGPRGRD